MRYITALEIASNHPNGDIKIDSYKIDATGKHGSCMYLMREGRIHKLMLSFDPNDKWDGFETSEEAIKKMEEVRDEAIKYITEQSQQQNKGK